jgi:predicted RNase H-like nuclease (RuvC/YqgF family)
MSTRRWFLFVASGLLCAIAGCVSAKAPERIEVSVGGSSQPEPVDSGRVPDPRTLEEARAELRKAYANVQWLERKVDDLAEDKAEYKRERDRYKKERDKFKDRLEDYEDD